MFSSRSDQSRAAVQNFRVKLENVCLPLDFNINLKHSLCSQKDSEIFRWIWDKGFRVRLGSVCGFGWELCETAVLTEVQLNLEMKTRPRIPTPPSLYAVKFSYKAECTHINLPMKYITCWCSTWGEKGRRDITSGQQDATLVKMTRCQQSPMHSDNVAFNPLAGKILLTHFQTYYTDNLFIVTAIVKGKLHSLFLKLLVTFPSKTLWH